MEDVSRYVNIAFLLTGLIMAWVMVRTSEMVLAWAGPGADPIVAAGIQLSTLLGIVIGGGVTFYYWQKQRTNQLATEVAVELSKVAWPDSDETKQSTIVVIVFAIITALVLFFFDFVWKFATDAILSVG